MSDATIPNSPRVNKIMVLAEREAKRRGDNYVASEDLLVGLLEEHEGVGARILEAAGVRVGDVRLEVEKRK